MFAYSVGCFERCWLFNSAAARTFIAVREQPSTHITPGEGNNGAPEFHRVFKVCYMVDKALSQSLNRTPSLPDVEWIAPLLGLSMEKAPDDYVLEIYLELGEAQDRISRTTQTSQGSIERLLNAQALQRSMQQTQAKIEKVSSRFSDLFMWSMLTVTHLQFHEIHGPDAFWDREIQGIKFAYYAIMVSIVRLHPNLHAHPILQQQEVEYAKQSLTSLSRMFNRTMLEPDAFAIRASAAWYDEDLQNCRALELLTRAQEDVLLPSLALLYVVHTHCQRARLELIRLSLRLYQYTFQSSLDGPTCFGSIDVAAFISPPHFIDFSCGFR